MTGEGRHGGGENWDDRDTSTKWYDDGQAHAGAGQGRGAYKEEKRRNGKGGDECKNKERSGSEWNGWNDWGYSYSSNDSKEPVDDNWGWGPPKEGNLHFKEGEKLFCREPHHPLEMHDVFDTKQMAKLKEIWDAYHDDLDNPKLTAKPILSIEHLKAYHHLAMTAVQEMSNTRGEPLSLDQATISATTGVGHKKHADNLVFGVWRYDQRVYGPIEKEIDEARKDGAEVWWRLNTTSHRNYAMTINLVDPEDFEGGVVNFYHTLGAYEPYASYKAKAGSGVCFCGCHKCIHEVTGITRGFRLCLLVWTRPAGMETPIKSKKTHYHRPGTGNAVWLTLADLPGHIQNLVCYPKTKSRNSTTSGGNSDESCNNGDSEMSPADNGEESHQPYVAAAAME